MLDRAELIVATGNAHKVEEMAEALGRWFKVRGLPADYGAPPEDGETFAANARIKAEAAARASGCLSLADDSGICVDALEGGPGIHSARFAGTHGDDAANNSKLLKALEGTAAEQRGAHFVCALSLADPRGQVFACQGEWFGRIGDVEKGDGGFGYDPLFITADGRSAAELPAAEKQQQSHRAKALAKLVCWLEERRTVIPQ